MLTIERLKSLADILTMRAEWDTILKQRTDSTINDTFDWILNLYRFFATPQNSAFLVFSSNRRIVALVPMVIVRRYIKKMIPYTQLIHIGSFSKLTDFCNIHCLPEFENKVLARLLNYKGVQQVLISPVTTIPIELWSQYPNGIKTSSRILSIDFSQYSTFSDYVSKRSKNTRKELVKRQNKLSKYKTWHIRFETQMTKEHWKAITTLHQGRQQQLQRSSILCQHPYQHFIEAIIETFNNRSLLYSLLTIDDRPISFTLGFIYNSIYYHWLVGFDPAFSELSPNKLHHFFLIEKLAKNCKEFNFMRGDANYKYQWTHTYQPAFEIKLWNRSTLYNQMVCVVKSPIKENHFS
jgi:CelD/BcsL family acetyltransferase involved in cellulose biosynthesis